MSGLISIQLNLYFLFSRLGFPGSVALMRKWRSSFPFNGNFSQASIKPSWVSHMCGLPAMADHLQYLQAQTCCINCSFCCVATMCTAFTNTKQIRHLISSTCCQYFNKSRCPVWKLCLATRSWDGCLAPLQLAYWDNILRIEARNVWENPAQGKTKKFLSSFLFRL